MASTQTTNESAFSLSDCEDFLQELEAENFADVVENLEIIACSCGTPSTKNLTECSTDSCDRLFHLDCMSGSQERRPGPSSQNTSTASTPELRRDFCAHCSSEEHLKRPEGLESEATPEATTSSTATSAVQPTKTKKNKAHMVYPESTFEPLQKSRVDHFTRAMKSVESEPVYKLKTPLATQVKVLATKILGCIGEDSLQSFASGLENSVWTVIKPLQGASWSEKKKSDMWMAFHKIRCEKELLTKWQETLSSINCRGHPHSEVVLLQYVLKTVHRTILTQLLEHDVPRKEVTQGPKRNLEVHEEQALRYCSGYVPFKLIRRYRKKQNSNSAKLLVSVLNSWSETEQSHIEDTGFLNYTKEWINARNRGGLFVINDNSFRFFRCMEKVTQETLESHSFVKLQKLDVQSLLMEKIHRDKFVMNMWGRICDQLPPDLSKKLLEDVVKCYVSMRVTAYLKVVLMIQKEKLHLSKTGEKSLRKELVKV